MKKANYSVWFEVLELDENATEAEVKNAYKALKKLYSEDSMLTAPLAEEFLDSNREGILAKIEEAYAELKKMFAEMHREEKNETKDFGIYDRLEASDQDWKTTETTETTEPDAFNGPMLRNIRERLNMELMDIAYTTKISRRYIESIEDEKFEELPEEVYVRGYLYNYAKHLSLDPKKVTAAYMNRYSEWKKRKEKRD